MGLSLTFTTVLPNGRLKVLTRSTVPKRCILKQAQSYADLDVVESFLLPQKSIEFPFGPNDVQYKKLAPAYSQIKRPTLAPLLIRTAPELRTVTFNATIANLPSGGQASVESELELLHELAAEDRDLNFIYGLSVLPYRVRVTQLSIKSKRRDLDGALVRADVSIQLTERVEFDPTISGLTAVTPTGVLGTLPTPANVERPPIDEDATPKVYRYEFDGGVDAINVEVPEVFLNLNDG